MWTPESWIADSVNVPARDECLLAIIGRKTASSVVGYLCFHWPSMFSDLDKFTKSLVILTYFFGSYLSQPPWYGTCILFRDGMSTTTAALIFVESEKLTQFVQRNNNNNHRKSHEIWLVCTSMVIAHSPFRKSFIYLNSLNQHIISGI